VCVSESDAYGGERQRGEKHERIVLVLVVAMILKQGDGVAWR
jgi:hypothetical protein